MQLAVNNLALMLAAEVQLELMNLEFLDLR